VGFGAGARRSAVVEAILTKLGARAPLRVPALRALVALGALGNAPACAPKAPPPAAPTGVEPAMSPILPAAVAPLYALGEIVPRDPLVRATVEAGGLPWVESLSGAAGRLAMGSEGPPDLVSARWAATRAGYPYDVQQVIVGEEVAGGYPTGLAELIRQKLRPGDQIGLARARVLERDRWVVIIGRPALQLPDFPREQRQGAVLQLAADRPGRWTLVSPVGVIHEGALPVAAVLDLDGEWWLHIEGVEGRLGLPLYVDIPTPASSLVGDAPRGLKGPQDAEAAVLQILGDVREAFGAPALQLDPTLRALTAHPLEALQAGQLDHGAAEARLRAAGFLVGPSRVLSCKAPDAAVCMDSLLRAPEARSALLDPTAAVVGLSLVVSTEGLALVLALTGG